MIEVATEDGMDAIHGCFHQQLRLPSHGGLAVVVPSFYSFCQRGCGVDIKSGTPAKPEGSASSLGTRSRPEMFAQLFACHSPIEHHQNFFVLVVSIS